MSKQIQSNKIGIYMRLSRDDEKAGESMSIEHQRIILRKYVEEHGGVIVDEYVDDGFSGTNFDRPEVQRLLSDAQTGKIDTIIVKDLSRFGRNYIQVGQYIDYIFPAYGIRFIALNDNVDTADRTSTAMDMMPIMNVFNEWHAANTSKKIRAVFEASQRAGKYTNWNYPYGYKAGNDENRTAVIDEEAAKVVRTIFDLRLQGYSLRAIGKYLADENIPNPATYYTRLDGSKSNKTCNSFWSGRTISWILTNETYLGKTMQHKTTRVSYKNHKVVPISKDDWIVKENAHEPIIDIDTWNKVQEINHSVSRGKADKQKIKHLLSGFVVCQDCGQKCKLNRTREGHYSFVCRTYKDYGNRYCSSHSITEKMLEEIVLRDIQSMLQSVQIDEAKEKEAFLRERAKSSEQSRFSDEKQLKALKSRLVDLDKLIRSAFEKSVLKGMSETVLNDLCTEYSAEKESVLKTIEELEKRLAKARQDNDEAEEYIAKLKRYAGLESLTREACLQLIDFITVAQKQKDGKREIHIYYKFSHGESLKEFRSKIKSIP